MGLFYLIIILMYLAILFTGTSILILYIIRYKLFSISLIVSTLISSFMVIFSLNNYVDEIISNNRGAEYATLYTFSQGVFSIFSTSLFVGIFLAFLWRKNRVLVGVSLSLSITSLWWLVRLINI